MLNLSRILTKTNNGNTQVYASLKVLKGPDVVEVHSTQLGLSIKNFRYILQITGNRE